MPNPNDLSLAGLKTYIDESLYEKIDRVEGKGLSTNDFTNEYKTQLESVTQSIIDSPLIPTTTTPDYVLKSTAVAGVYTWKPVGTYDHSKMTADDRKLHLTDEDRTKINFMVTTEYLQSQYYTKGETESKIYSVFNDFTNSTSILSTIKEINDAFNKTHENTTLANYLLGQLENKVDKDGDKGLSTYDFDYTYKTKVDALSNYTLPVATEDILGGVKVGYGLRMDSDRLAIDTNAIVTKDYLVNSFNTHQITLPIASTSTLGGIKLPSSEGIYVDENGVLHVDREESNINIDNINTAIAGKLDKECILCGTGIFNGGGTVGGAIQPVRIPNPTGKSINICSITKMDNTGGTGDFYYQVDSDTNEVLIYNAGVSGGRFSYLIILQDD